VIHESEGVAEGTRKKVQVPVGSVWGPEGLAESGGTAKCGSELTHFFRASARGRQEAISEGFYQGKGAEKMEAERPVKNKERGY